MRIDLSSVEYSTNSFKLGPVTLSIEEGKVLGIGGPNGSGKSTLLRLILHLLRPDSGRISIDGVDIAEMVPKDLSRKLSYLPQNLFSPLNLSVQDVLLASEYSMDTKSSKLDALIERYELASLRHRDFNTLSGGEKRLVMLIGAINQGSGAILMDEPDTFLDVDKEMQVMDEIRTLRDSGRIVVIILHDLNKLAAICDNILMLKSGKVMALGPTDSVLVPEILEKMYSASFRVEEVAGSRRIEAFPRKSD